MPRPQRIRDPLHNLIEFRGDEFEDAMWRVIQTRPFQRLRRVKQLGFSDLVYPGATHSRFSHSVGVFHTARVLMQVIRNHLGENNFKPAVANIALAGALVHDLGHGPFSHAFEEVGKRLKIKMAKHEDVSDSLIRNGEVAQALSVLGSGFANDVADVIKSKGPQNIYGAVVSSQFDADRLDYMQRDRLMSGTQHGMIDFKWLIANLKVGKVPIGVDEMSLGEIETFVLGPKAVYAAESYVLGLFQLYPTVYFHKTTRGAEKLFTELFCRVIQLIKDGSLDKTGLPDSHPVTKFSKESDSLENVIALDDAALAFRSVVREKISRRASCGKECLFLLQSDPHITAARIGSSAIGLEDDSPSTRDWYIESFINDISLPRPQSYYGVKPATNGDITTAYQIYSNNRQTFLKKQENTNHADIEAAAKLYAQGKEFLADTPYNSHPCRKLVQVDLTLPVSVLKKSFSEFLKVQKKDIEKSASPFFKNQEFAFWFSSGALPYLDLQMWEVESGQSFRWSAFVDALIILTEEDVASEDSCRKTAKTLAAKLMDKRTIHLLKFQAFKEISEGRKKSGTLFVR